MVWARKTNARLQMAKKTNKSPRGKWKNIKTARLDKQRNVQTKKQKPLWVKPNEEEEVQ